MNVYEECPSYKKNSIMLRKTKQEDIDDLIKCYSDMRAVRFFNSDNCHGDDFHYDSIEKMTKAIDFWNYSYDEKYFVRWSVILVETNEIVGTIEMFHRNAEDEFNHFGVLRIDLRSDFEKTEIISSILEIANEEFYTLFDVKSILTKSFPLAIERTKALKQCGYHPLGEKFMIYDDYYARKI